MTISGHHAHFSAFTLMDEMAIVRRDWFGAISRASELQSLYATLKHDFQLQIIK
jgi:hypothetical protein